MIEEGQASAVQELICVADGSALIEAERTKGHALGGLAQALEELVQAISVKIRGDCAALLQRVRSIDKTILTIARR